MQNKINLIEKKKIQLYSDFLLSVWTKLYYQIYEEDFGSFDEVINEYHKLFFMISEKQQATNTDAIDLIEWINTHNNGVLPDNLQQLFNEFLLERL